MTATPDWLVFAPGLLLLGGVLLLAYVKIGVVLAVLRRGLGGIPPAGLTAILALLLSWLAMAPLAERCQQAMSALPATAPATERLEAGLGPLRTFLSQHTPEREKAAVKDLVTRLRGTAPGPELPSQLVAYALAELRVAFQAAFVLLLPFLLIDLLCASLLGGLLLPGLSARAVALPFKLLLFVACDGWQLLTRGLLTAYGGGS